MDGALITIATQGRYDFIDITERVAHVVLKSEARDGVVVCFVRHTTVGLTIMEWEEGIKRDLVNLWEKLAPEAADYEHHKRWVDHNGAAHVKSALIGVDLSVPFEDGKLLLGTWQRIVLIDFDERPRTREMVIKILPCITG